MNNFVIPNEGHVVNLIAPVDINGGAVTGDIFSMENYSHVDIIIQLGVTGAASTVTVKECDDFSPSNSTAIAFKYAAEATAGGDTLGSLTACASTGFATGTANGIFYVISIDAAELSAGYPCIQLNMSDPSASTFVSAVAVLSGARYAEDASATVIA